MIELKDVNFSYNENPAANISSINLRIGTGEFVLLCGRSGCGKTTVTRLLNGLISHFYEGKLQGEAFIDGHSIHNMKLHQIARMVGSVFQDPRSQFFTVDTVWEIVFSCENMGIPRAEMLHRLDNTVNVLNIRQLLHRSLFRLSSGEKQKIAIASVHAAGPIIYVLDEPSANLDYQSTEELRAVLTVLKEKGHTIIIAEHRLHYLRDLIDRAIYMDGGKIVAEYDREKFLTMPDTERINRGLRCVFPERLQRSGEEMTAPQTYLQLEGVVFRYGSSSRILDAMYLKAGQGEIIGITGLNGAGKSTFAKFLCGLISEQQGQVHIESRLTKAGGRLEKSYFVMQDADYQLFTESVEEELRLGNEQLPDLAERVAETLATLGLTALKSRHPASLSGGQKQRVTIAVAIVKGANILIFDEPTSGLDADNMRRVASLLRKVAAAGKTVFVITHDYEFIVHTCSRIVNLAGGRFSADFFLNNSSLSELKKLFNID